MSILWEKSGTWRCIVNKTRDSKPFFWPSPPSAASFRALLATSLCRRPTPETNSSRPSSAATPDLNPWCDSRMGQVNKERLAEFLGELQRKENTNDRYVAALKGETLTRNPYVRIQPIPKPSNTEAEKEQK
ncbi:unnamed protein product [Malus baccata var. baccata]